MPFFLHYYQLTGNQTSDRGLTLLVLYVNIHSIANAEFFLLAGKPATLCQKDLGRKRDQCFG